MRGDPVEAVVATLPWNHRRSIQAVTVVSGPARRPESRSTSRCTARERATQYLPGIRAGLLPCGRGPGPDLQGNHASMEHPFLFEAGPLIDRLRAGVKLGVGRAHGTGMDLRQRWSSRRLSGWSSPLRAIRRMRRHRRPASRHLAQSLVHPVCVPLLGGSVGGDVGGPCGSPVRLDGASVPSVMKQW